MIIEAYLSNGVCHNEERGKIVPALSLPKYTLSLEKTQARLNLRAKSHTEWRRDSNYPCYMRTIFGYEKFLLLLSACGPQLPCALA